MRAVQKTRHWSGAPPAKERGQRLPANPLLRFGGARRDRTVDLYNAIVALSQLSYGPETCAGGGGIGRAPAACNRQRSPSPLSSSTSTSMSSVSSARSSV